MVKIYFNIWSTYHNDFRLSSGFETREEAQSFLTEKMLPRLKEVNIGRVTNGYDAIPEGCYSVQETEHAWTLDIPESELSKLTAKFRN